MPRHRVTPTLVELLVVAAPWLGCAANDDATAQTSPASVGSAGDDTAGDDVDTDVVDDAANDDDVDTDDPPTSTTSADEATDTTDSTPFIQEPDGGGPGVECDIWAQDCPRDQKCMPWVNDGGQLANATHCTALDPNPAQVSDPCTVEGNPGTGIDNCDEGALCWHVDPDTNMGTCIELCQGSPNAPVCSDPQTSCNIVNDGVLILCLPDCHPLLQDCPLGEACYPTPAGFNCAPDFSGEDGAAGDPCGAINDCDEGNFCIGAAAVPGCASDQCCSQFCDLTEPTNVCSVVGQQCLSPFDGQPPPGFEDLGQCALP